MIKNISIHIGGIIFHIEKDGYDKLKDYLETAKRNVRSFKEKSEIMAYIENSIAETFLYNLKNRIQVVTVEDVEEFIGTKEGLARFYNIKNTNQVYLF